MKKLMLVTLLFLATTFAAKAQFAYRIDLVKDTAQLFIGYFSNKDIDRIRDIDYREFYSKRILISRLDSTHNDGTLTRIVGVDNKGNLLVGTPSGGSAKTPHSIASGARNFNQGYQVSTTQEVDVNYSVSIVCTLSLTTGQAGDIYLEYSANGSTGWTFAGQQPASNTGTLVVGLNTSQREGGSLSVHLPAGYYWRLRTNNVTGTPTYTFLGGTETY